MAIQASETSATHPRTWITTLDGALTIEDKAWATDHFERTTDRQTVSGKAYSNAKFLIAGLVDAHARQIVARTSFDASLAPGPLPYVPTGELMARTFRKQKAEPTLEELNRRVHSARLILGHDAIEVLPPHGGYRLNLDVVDADLIHIALYVSHHNAEPRNSVWLHRAIFLHTESRRDLPRISTWWVDAKTVPPSLRAAFQGWKGRLDAIDRRTRFHIAFPKMARSKESLNQLLKFNANVVTSERAPVVLGRELTLAQRRQDLDIIGKEIWLVDPGLLLPKLTNSLTNTKHKLDEGLSTRARASLQQLLCEMTAYAGWLHYLAGRPAEARRHYRHASDLASHLDQPDLTALVHMLSSYLTTHISQGEAGRSQRSIDHLDAGLAVVKEGAEFAYLRSTLLSRRAEEHAAAGDGAKALADLDVAERCLDVRTPPTGFYYNWTGGFQLEGYRGIIALQIGDRSAVDILTQARVSLDNHMTRRRYGGMTFQRSAITIDLAAALITVREIDEACHYLGEAATLTGGMSVLHRRIDGVQKQLGPWSALPVVRDLEELLRNNESIGGREPRMASNVETADKTSSL